MYFSVLISYGRCLIFSISGNMWQLYLILSLIVLYLICRAFIKIKFHFWSIQPVFHIYDLYYWFKPNQIIDPALPDINKYVNLIDIKTKKVEDLTELEISRFCSFLKLFYLRSKEANYIPEPRHIMEYLKGGNHPSFVSIYKTPKMLFDAESAIVDHELSSVISARPLHITLKNQKTFPIYYIDNLCVNPAMRKQGVAPKAIQTLYYDIRRRNRKINTYLFKREGEMTAIVPLTTFTCKGYKLSNIVETRLTHASMQVIEITKQNLVLIADFIAKRRSHLECAIVPDMTSIANIIKADNIAVYGIIENGNLISLYLLRDAASEYDGKRAMEVVSSLNACHHEDIFISGFTIAIHRAAKRWKSELVLIDELASNGLLTKSIGAEPFLTSPSAFFLYNYATYTLPPDKCFVFY